MSRPLSITGLARKEIRHRPLNFMTAVLVVCVAVAVVVGTYGSLGLQKVRTGDLLARKQQETVEYTNRLLQTYKRIAHKMGHNVLVLPEGTTKGEFFGEGIVRGSMPENDFANLLKSDLSSVSHIQPVLREKRVWPETNRTVIFRGIGREVILGEGDDVQPVGPRVQPGTVLLGYELHWGPEIRPGDRIRIMGRSFVVGECLSQRGSKEDIEIVMQLDEAQSILDREGRINAIEISADVMPLEKLAAVRAGITRTVPNVTVLELSNKIMTQVKSLRTAAKTAGEALEREKEARLAGIRKHSLFALAVSSSVAVGAAIIVGILALVNVRDRRGEIGVLRALGVDKNAVFKLFVVRAVVAGVAGGIVGVLIGMAATGLFSSSGGNSIKTLSYMYPVLLLAPVATPLLAIVAVFFPARSASLQDPAVTLSVE